MRLKRYIKNFNYILYRLEDTDLKSLPETLQQMKQKELISREMVAKLLEKPYTFPEMIAVLKETKKGAGVT